MAALTSAAAGKPFGLVAKRGPAQPDLEPLFTALDPDVAFEGPRDVDNQPIVDEPVAVRRELDELTGIAAA